MSAATQELNDLERAHICRSAGQCLRYGSSSLGTFPGLLRKIIDARAWESRTLKDGRTVKSTLAEVITAPPILGWGEDINKVEAVICDEPELLADFREALKHQGARPKEDSFVDNVNEVERSTGNSRSYTLARLKRDHGELFARVCDGELSANAAAIEAGFRKPPPSPVESIKKLWAKLTPEETEHLHAWIAKQ